MMGKRSGLQHGNNINVLLAESQLLCTKISRFENPANGNDDRSSLRHKAHEAPADKIWSRPESD